MAHLLSIPENVMIKHVLPCLDHNDVLRLRRVSKQTKAFADAYLWTPQPGHQGKWELEIDSSKEDHSLQAFLQLGLPPPSRLHIANKAENGPSEQRSFFEDEHLEEFMERYSKYVTNLRVDNFFFPFTSSKEIGFYESLVNLKELQCFQMITVGGAAQFEEKTKRAEGSFIIRPTFKKLKIFYVEQTDCTDSMWNFISGVSSNLEELFHPFSASYLTFPPRDKLHFNLVRELIERRGMNSQSKLLYDWGYLSRITPLQLLRLFASCRDNGVFVKNLDACLLDCLLCDENGNVADRDEVADPITREWIRSSLVTYQRNLFVGSVIHSLKGVIDTVFLMELPALENITALDKGGLETCPRRGCGYPEWPNLRKMHVYWDKCSDEHLDYLWGQCKRPKLEELCLTMLGFHDVAGWRIPRNFGNCCENLKRLTISFCAADDNLFLSLWEQLPLLEDVTLEKCWMLTNKGFQGNGDRRSSPALLKLEKLKHLTIKNLEETPGITDVVFMNVFRHLKLSSFELSSDKAIESITVEGIRVLLIGQFAETIEKLKLDDLRLKDVSEGKLKEVVSCFRSSKML